MKLNTETIESFLKSLECRYEREKMSLAGVDNVEIRLFNHTTGEQAARLEFINDALTRIDYWDLEEKTIQTIMWNIDIHGRSGPGQPEPTPGEPQDP
jgi:hypothetical protein